jgi:hypothetical protein
MGDEPPAVAPVMAAAESGPRTKRARIGDIVRSFSDAVAAQADYFNKNGQFAFGDLQYSSKVDNVEKVCALIYPASKPCPLPSSPLCTAEEIGNICDLYTWRLAFPTGA